MQKSYLRYLYEKLSIEELITYKLKIKFRFLFFPIGFLSYSYILCHFITIYRLCLILFLGKVFGLTSCLFVLSLMYKKEVYKSVRLKSAFSKSSIHYLYKLPNMSIYYEIHYTDIGLLWNKTQKDC